MNLDSTIICKILRKEPISRRFGYNRGLPIDRYYIERFLNKNRNFIKGVVAEVGNGDYIKKFGQRNVKEALIINKSCDDLSQIKQDLVSGEGTPKNKLDCFILTQTLPFIFGVNRAVINACRALKKNGVLLVTVSGITQISRYDMDRWGHYWSFTDLSLKKIFEPLLPKKLKIETYGNVKSATALLYGLASQELSRKDLEFKDPDYPVIITAVVQKK